MRARRSASGLAGIALILLLAGSPARTNEAACDFGAAHDDAPPELSQFAFLIGDHEIKLYARQGSGWTPPRPVDAAWNGRYGLDGLAIYDEWLDPGWGQNPGGSGVNVRAYDAANSVWKMMWISTAGYQVQDLRAEMRDGVLTMWQVYPERLGWKAEFRETGATSWERVEYQQDETTGTWVPRFRLEALRQPCG